MNIGKFIKLFIPPIAINLLRKIKSITSQYGWHGDYPSWDEAKKHSTGYEDDKILQKVKDGLLKVKKGEAAYERDGVLFDKIEYSWPLLSGILLAASINKGQLSVLDFGGSLGSTYFQNRKFLNLLQNVSWNIIEQPHFVREGQLHFQDERLHFYFYEDIETCIKTEKPDVLLLSSVLCYLEKPYEILENLLSYNFPFVIIDRTPLHKKGYDRITIQRVPPWIYKTSYPCWILDKQKLLLFFQKRNYQVIEEFDALDGKIGNIQWKGLIFYRLGKVK